MRGTPNRRGTSSLLQRIIPAYAGNTLGALYERTLLRDHPRVCGEHRTVSENTVVVPGSSPRMRGTPEPELVRPAPHGIIPAYAGNTRHAPIQGVPHWDHPRVCGEHSVETLKKSASAGSSPRMRGTLKALKNHDVSSGIIPAYAGNTAPRPWKASPCRDHPRVCGEHQSAPTETVQCKGSSPRMRGTPHQHAHDAVRQGIIPAYAGNTMSMALASAISLDHPRVCGEHSSGRGRRP